MYKKRTFVGLLIEFTNGEKEWYCASRVLRHALLCEKKVNQFWKNTMIGNYLTVSTSEYRHDLTKLTVGKVVKIRLSHRGSSGYTWTRNQFVTPEHLRNFRDAYNYLKHDYKWYNRLAIYRALLIWHNQLVQKDLKSVKKQLGRKRHQLYKLQRWSKKYLKKASST